MRTRTAIFLVLVLLVAASFGAFGLKVGIVTDIHAHDTILDEAEAIYAGLSAPRYYVIGNHDVYDLSKEEILEHTAASFTYGSFDAGGYHFVILDAQYDRDGDDLDHAGWVVQGNIPDEELDWRRGTFRTRSSTGSGPTSPGPTSRRSSVSTSASMSTSTSYPGTPLRS